MTRNELNQFLAAVRKTTFTDYLDPIGEPTLQAFERRLKWAERVIDDPSYTEEASFLLDHKVALREVVQREDDQESNWVEVAEVGEEHGKKAAWRQGSTITPDMIDANDLEPTPMPAPPRASSAPTKLPPAAKNPPAKATPTKTPPAAKGTAKASNPGEVVEPTRTEPFAPSRVSTPKRSQGAQDPGTGTMIPEDEDDPWDEEATGIMQLEDVTPTPPDRVSRPDVQPSATKLKPSLTPTPSKVPAKPPPAAKAPPVAKTPSAASSKPAPPRQVPPVAKKPSPTPAPAQKVERAPTPPPVDMSSRTVSPSLPPSDSRLNTGATPGTEAPSPLKPVARDIMKPRTAAAAPIPSPPPPQVEHGGTRGAGIAIAGGVAVVLALLGVGSWAIGLVGGSKAPEVAVVAPAEPPPAEVAPTPTEAAAPPLDVPPTPVEVPAVAAVEAPKPEVVKVEPPKPESVKVDPKDAKTKDAAAKEAAAKEAAAKAAKAKADEAAKAEAAAKAAEAAKTATAPAVPPPSLKGLWTGKIDGKPLYLTIQRVDGSSVVASAEASQGDTFVTVPLTGSWDESGLNLSLSGGGASFSGSFKDGRFAGSATLPGGGPVGWSARK